MNSALELLTTESLPDCGPLAVVFGDDDYLKREVLLKLRAGEAVDAYGGREVEWRDVHDALTMTSLFGDGAQVVVIEEADPFVKEYRDKLEHWVDVGRAPRTLVLDVKSWPRTTRLAKTVEKVGLAVECAVPADNKGGRQTKFVAAAKKWLTQRAKKVHQVAIERSACDELFELLPLSLGLMDQEVAKLSLLAGDGKIDVSLVQANVGDWRTRQTWDMIDAMVEGRAADALAQLDRLLAAGEQPIAILAQVAYTLRKFATAARLVEQAEAAGNRVALPQIVAAAGFWKNKAADAVRQLKLIGRARAEQLANWLLAADLAMKDHNSAPEAARLELERLIVRLSKAASHSGRQTPAASISLQST